MAYANTWTHCQDSGASIDIIKVTWEKSDGADPKVLPKKTGSFLFTLTGDWPTHKTSIGTKITADDGVDK